MTVGHTAGRARGCNRRARNPACIARTVPAPGTRYIQLKITRQIKYVLKEDCKQRNLLNFKCYQYQVCFTGTLLYRLCTIKQISDPYWFQCGSGSNILDQCGSECESRFKILITKNKKKFTAEKNV
jgi:hypothetical protein